MKQILLPPIQIKRKKDITELIALEERLSVSDSDLLNSEDYQKWSKEIEEEMLAKERYIWRTEP